MHYFKNIILMNRFHHNYGIISWYFPMYRGNTPWMEEILDELMAYKSTIYSFFHSIPIGYQLLILISSIHNTIQCGPPQLQVGL